MAGKKLEPVVPRMGEHGGEDVTDAQAKAASQTAAIEQYIADKQKQVGASPQLLPEVPGVTLSTAQQQQAAARGITVVPQQAYDLAQATKKASWATSSVEIKQQAVSQASRALGSSSIPWSKSFTKYPQFALAAASALNGGSINASQIKTVATAVDMLDATYSIALATSDETRRNIFNRFSAPQQAAILAISDALYKEYQANAAKALEQATQEAGTVKQWVGEHVGAPLMSAVGKAFDGMLWLNDQAQHFYRAELTSLTTGKDIYAAWADTGTGQIDKQSYSRLQAKYGAEKVDVVRDWIQMSNSDNENGFAELVDKYQNNPAALQIIDQIMLDSERTQEISDLLNEVDVTRRDDLGNLAANQVFSGPLEGMRGNAAYTLLDKSVNGVAVFFGDPTLIAGKGVKAYKVFRYGLLRNLGAGTLEKAMSSRKVQAAFKDLSQGIAAYNDEFTVAGRAQIRAQIRATHGKYLTDDAIDSLSAYAKNRAGVAPKGSLVEDWLVQSDGLEKLLAGKAPVRAEQVLLPRMGAVRKARIEAQLAAKRVIGFDKNSIKLAQQITDPMSPAALEDFAKSPDAEYWRQLEMEQQAWSAVRALEDPALQSAVASKYGVNLERVKTLFVGPERNKPVYTYRGWNVTPQAMRARIERLSSKFELMPDGGRISIADASDSRQVYAWARAVGYDRYFANTVEEIWRIATPGQRRLMWDGLVRTAGKTMGIADNEMESLLVSSSRAEEQYSATLIRREDMLDDTEMLAASSARAARMNEAVLGVAARSESASLRFRMAQLINESKRIRADIIAAKQDIAAQKVLIAKGQQVKKDLQQLSNKLDALHSARTANWFELKNTKALREEVANGGEQSAYTFYNPSEFNGRQHALQKYQIADSVQVPDFAKMQQLSAKVGVLNKMLGISWNRGLGTFTDLWSFGNLFGPRYVARNTPEDVVGYVLSGGSWGDLAVGRRMAGAVRQARGKREGIFTETARALADRNSTIAQMIFPHLDESEILAARQAAVDGDTYLIQQLGLKALARKKLGWVPGQKLSKTDEEFFNLFMADESSLRQLDEIAEVARNLHSAKLVEDTSASYGQMRIGMGEFRTAKIGPWKNVEFTDDKAFTYWLQSLKATLHGDGRMGQLVFSAMRTSGTQAAAKQKVLPRLVEFLRSDEGISWKRQFSAFDEAGVTEEVFASRYFDAVSEYFATPGGGVNKKLINRLTVVDEKTGAKYGEVYSKAEDGQRIYNVFLDDLRKFGSAERPKAILGREEGYVKFAEDVNLIDKMWEFLSESMARITREPIYMARTKSEYATLRKGLLQKYLDAGLNEATAQKMIYDLAKQRGEMLTLSYVDNPRMRTVAAWNVRNVARYYRATEDFYRRMLRLAEYHPESIQKVALSYDMLDHSGFIFTDDQGVKYFQYPGTGLLTQAITSVVNAFNGQTPMLNNPFGFNGQVLMLSPSADVNSWLPAFASPLTAIPLKALTAFGPGQHLESLLMGSRAAKPTGEPVDLANEILTSVLPSHVLRGLALLNQDERNSQYASAVKSAIAVLAYNGDLDPEKIADTREVQYRDEILSKVEAISLGVLGLRFMLGFVLPASPELSQSTDVSIEAQQAGIKSLRRGYTQLLQKYNGDPALATAAWFKLNPRLMPFTVSSTETGKQVYPSVSTESEKWMIQNSSFVGKHSEASVFLIPRGNDFSFKAYSMARAAGMIEGKSIQDMFRDAATAQDYYRYEQTKLDYEDALLAASPYERDQVNAKWDAYVASAKAANPYLAQRIQSGLAKSTQAVKNQVLNDMRAALDDIYFGDRKLVSGTTDMLSWSVAYFDEKMIELSRYTGSDNYSEMMRKNIRAEMRSKFAAVTAKDLNAKNFYEYILDPLIGGK